MCSLPLREFLQQTSNFLHKVSRDSLLRHLAIEYGLGLLGIFLHEI